MKVDEVVFVKPGLSARLFAVELGVTDFTRELTEVEAAVLLCAGHFDAHGITTAEISGVLRWIGQHLPAELGYGGVPPLITFLDYQDVVCSFIKDEGYTLGVGPVSLYDIGSRPHRSVSTAFSLRGVMFQQERAQERLKTTARISKSTPPRA